MCCLLWHIYEMHLALFLKSGCDIGMGGVGGLRPLKVLKNMI
jgi:hypothetical protein